MSLRVKSMLFVIVVVVATIATVQAVHSHTSLQRLRTIETEQIVADVGRVGRQISSAVLDVAGTNADWAYWDDSYEFTIDANKDFADANLYADAFVPIDIDVLAYVDNLGNVPYSGWFRADGEVAAPPELLDELRPGGLLAGLQGDEVRTGIMNVADTTLLVSVRGVRDSDETLPPVGVLLMAREVTGEFNANLAELTNLDLSLTACLEPTCGPSQASATVERSNDALSATLALTDIGGKPALRIDVTDSRDLYGAGLAGVKRTVAFTALIALASIAIALVLVRMLVTRIEQLGSAARRVTETGDHGVRVPQVGSDEVATLARSINEMLASLEQAKADTDRASEAKSHFLARVSHEVRNPLNAVTVYSQLLELDDLDESQSESVEQILVATRHIDSLLEEFLDMARIEAGLIPLTIGATNLGEAVGETLDLLRPSATQQSITLEHRGSVDNHALADPTRLRQILLNLVSNGIKYNTEGGSVSVEHDVDESRVIVSVKDTGPGIPPEALRRLFVPFDRLDADERDQTGNGIGLTVTKSLVELMGGAIHVESTLNEGTTVFVELPMAGPTEADKSAKRDEGLNVLALSHGASDLTAVTRLG